MPREASVPCRTDGIEQLLTVQRGRAAQVREGGTRGAIAPVTELALRLEHLRAAPDSFGIRELRRRRDRRLGERRQIGQSGRATQLEDQQARTVRRVVAALHRPTDGDRDILLAAYFVADATGQHAGLGVERPQAFAVGGAVRGEFLVGRLPWNTRLPPVASAPAVTCTPPVGTTNSSLRHTSRMVTGSQAATRPLKPEGISGCSARYLRRASSGPVTCQCVVAGCRPAS